MIITPVASRKSLIHALCCPFGHQFYKSRIGCRITFFILAALATVLVASPATADQGFALIGTWLHSEPPATPETGAQSWMQVFKPDGTYYTQIMIAPRGRMVGTILRRWSMYKATGASSFVFKNKAFDRCASGGTACLRCPGQRMCTQNPPMGWDIGVQHSDSVTMQGQDRFRNRFGQTWTRSR